MEKAVADASAARDQKVKDAQYELGNMYNYGRGVPEDKEEAAKWYCS